MVGTHDFDVLVVKRFAEIRSSKQTFIDEKIRETATTTVQMRLLLTSRGMLTQPKPQKTEARNCLH